ncbi:type II toxin-antitoxin system Phd/YefM family antitoxin [Sorangium sp. So ce1153]|uniref:type II toxin-antitoxin system Phd/YefM family antitoxin n=1 Tax=Sorangium sp. So ce1153 TaxID=3133333 RepID=UPI003F629CB7
MKKINVAEDIVPIGEFKTHASELLRQLHATQRPLVITQNGKPAAVVITPDAFEEIERRELVKAKVEAGIASVEREGTLSSTEVRARLKAKVRASSGAR